MSKQTSVSKTEIDIKKLKKMYPKYKNYSFIPIIRGIVGIDFWYLHHY